MADPSKILMTAELPDGTKVLFNGVPFGTSSTAKGTQTKAVTIKGIDALRTGLAVRVMFTTAQTYNGAPKLQVNSLTAATIRRINGTNAGRYEWNAGEVIDFVYDGTYWVMVGRGLGTTTYPGLVSLSSAVNSTSEAVAATPNAVKQAYDLAALAIADIAPAYDATRTYAVGELRTNAGTLYKCTTAIATAEAWTAAHWTAATIADVIAAISGDPDIDQDAVDLYEDLGFIAST